MKSLNTHNQLGHLFPIIALLILISTYSMPVGSHSVDELKLIRADLDGTSKIETDRDVVSNPTETEFKTLPDQKSHSANADSAPKKSNGASSKQSAAEPRKKNHVRKSALTAAFYLMLVNRKSKPVQR